MHTLLTQTILYLNNTHGTTFLSVSIKFITRRLDKTNCLFYLIKKRIKTNQFLLRLGLITNAFAWGVFKNCSRSGSYLYLTLFPSFWLHLSFPTYLRTAKPSAESVASSAGATLCGCFSRAVFGVQLHFTDTPPLNSLQTHLSRGAKFQRR